MSRPNDFPGTVAPVAPAIHRRRGVLFIVILMLAAGLTQAVRQRLGLSPGS